MFRTRREFLIASCAFRLLLPRGASASGPWYDKKPAEWTPEDIQTVLNRSAWVREAPLEMERTPAGEVKKGKRSTEFQVIVRWESGLPVRLARRGASLSDKGKDRYLVSVSRLPMAFLSAMSGSGMAESTGKSEVAAQLAKTCAIERIGKEPIRCERAEWLDADFSPRVMISFPPVQDPIRLEETEVAVVGRIGALAFRARFPLRPMLYRGMLEL